MMNHNRIKLGGLLLSWAILLITSTGCTLNSAGSSSADDAPQDIQNIPLSTQIALDDLTAITSTIDLQALNLDTEEVSDRQSVTLSADQSLTVTGLFDAAGPYLVAIVYASESKTYHFTSSTINVTETTQEINLEEITLKQTGVVTFAVRYSDTMDQSVTEFGMVAFSPRIANSYFESDITFGSPTGNVAFSIENGTHSMSFTFIHKKEGEPTVNYQPLQINNFYVAAGVTTNIGAFVLTPE